MQNYITKGVAVLICPETLQNKHFLKILVFHVFDIMALGFVVLRFCRQAGIQHGEDPSL